MELGKREGRYQKVGRRNMRRERGYRKKRKEKIQERRQKRGVFSNTEERERLLKEERRAA